MARKGGLGKGLDALLQDTSQPAPAAAPSVDSGVTEAPINKVIPNPQQPRQIMKEEQLRELADSIIEHGVIQPLIVTYNETQDQYILIAGERRLRASQPGRAENRTRAGARGHQPAAIGTGPDRKRPARRPDRPGNSGSIRTPPKRIFPFT